MSHRPATALRTCLAATVAAVMLGPVLMAPVANAAPKPLKVASKVTITSFDGEDEENVKFRGKVTSQRAVCTRDRLVKLRQVDQKLAAGKARTNAKGKWKITFDGTRIEPGKFKATATRKVVRQGGRRIICKQAVLVKEIGV